MLTKEIFTVIVNFVKTNFLVNVSAVIILSTYCF